jgi:3-dehydroquinate synthase
VVTPLALALSYPVFVGRGVLDNLWKLVEQYAPNHRYAIIADDAVDALYASRVAASLPSSISAERLLRLRVPSGEANKSRAQWHRLSDELLAWGAGRDTTIIAIGGGVTGDLAGFVAATLHRGVPVVQVPTTLLAMVDSAVGGKTGVDTDAGKNLIGAFHNPSLVLADIDTLRSLPMSVRADGLAEMIKHGLIADADAFSELCGVLPRLSGSEGAEVSVLPELVSRSVSIKAHVVAQDAREAGLRHILNAGHTIAHAIEHSLHFGVSHGAAVAAGLVIETRMSEQLGIAEPGLGDVVADAVRRAGLPDGPPRSVSDRDLLEATRSDKKARAGTVRYALPERLGRMSPGADHGWSTPVSDDAVLAALAMSRSMAKQPAD